MLSLCAAPSSSTASFVSKPPVLSSCKSSAFHGVRVAQLWPIRNPPSKGSLSSGRTSTSLSSVVMMAKREDELKDIRTKSTEQLNEEIVELKGELFMLRLQRSVRNEFKSSEFRRMRKRIARMLTVKREREIDEGINKRISRKLDRQWKKSIVVKPPPSLLKLREEEAAEEAKESSA